jgi:hypothetical protein
MWLLLYISTITTSSSSIVSKKSARPQLENHHVLPTQKKNCASPAADGFPIPSHSPNPKMRRKIVNAM